jgi:hypothetical protein
MSSGHSLRVFLTEHPFLLCSQIFNGAFITLLLHMYGKKLKK